LVVAHCFLKRSKEGRKIRRKREEEGEIAEDEGEKTRRSKWERKWRRRRTGWRKSFLLQVKKKRKREKEKRKGKEMGREKKRKRTSI